ncbi:hypothetical protein L7F22_030603 [Adiantum nelumboides]|nr:hypothetical protein [Adiantum nelumboides]
MVSPFGNSNFMPPLLNTPIVQGMSTTFIPQNFYHHNASTAPQSFYTSASNSMQQEQRLPRPPYCPSNRPILCYRCGEYGHYQSKCALPEGSPPCHHRPDSKDHYSKDCPKQRASSSSGSTQNQQEFTFPKINLITVNTISQPSPATHVVNPQQIGVSAGVLTRAQRAALGLMSHQTNPLLVLKAVGIVEKVPFKVQEFTFNLDFVVVSLSPVEGGFPLLIGRPWLRHTKALHDWGNDAMWIHTPGYPMQSIRLEGGMDPVVHHSSLSVHFSPDLEQPTPPDGSDEDLLQWLQATTAMPCYVVSIQALPEDTPSSPATQAEQELVFSQSQWHSSACMLLWFCKSMAGGTRHKRREVLSKNQPSLEQEISAAEEEEERESAHSSHGATDMTSSDASDESYKCSSHMVDPDSSSQSDLGPSRGPQEQLQKLGLTALATARLPTDVPGEMVHELLNRFSKVRGHNLTPERIGHALGMTTFSSVKPTTRTYSKISKDATIQACQDLLRSDHPNYTRNMEL